MEESWSRKFLGPVNNEIRLNSTHSNPQIYPRHSQTQKKTRYSKKAMLSLSRVDLWNCASYVSCLIVDIEVIGYENPIIIELDSPGVTNIRITSIFPQNNFGSCGKIGALWIKNSCPYPIGFMAVSIYQ